MTATQLRRIRWAVRTVLALGVATSVAANVLHANDNPISQAIAAWPPLALLLTVELISRVPVHRRSLAAVRLGATATISTIAAWVSYWHMAGVAARYGEVGAAPYLIPLSVDGLVVVASVCLVELGGRLRTLADQPTTAPVPIADTEADTAPDMPADIAAAAKPDQAPQAQPIARRPRPDTAKAIARLRSRHPDMSSRDLARRLGISDRTVRRHLSAA